MVDATGPPLEAERISTVPLSNHPPAPSGTETVRTLRTRRDRAAPAALVATNVDPVDELMEELEGVADDVVTRPAALDDIVARVQDQQHRRTAGHEILEPLRRRISATESLVGLPASAGIEDISSAICDALIAETSGPTAGLYMFVSPRRAVLLAGRGLPGRDAPPGRKISQVVSSYLFTKARQGPWSGQARDLPIDSTRPRLQPHTPNDRGYIVAPIVRDDGPVGILFAGGPPGMSPQTLGRRDLATLLDFAGAAGMLLGANFLYVTDNEAARESLRARCRGHQFCTHFQPVVELATRRTVGHEALTRWDDGTPPDVPFAEARRIGLSPEIDIATLRGVLTAAADLPGDGWLSINLSAQTIIEDSGLAELFRETDRPLVIELTEHERIVSYEALRARLTEFGPQVRVAVDDAGAGYSTLSHVLALEPAMVKLDLSWVRGVDEDRPRQAMISGLVHFARETGCELIAEGVETVEELEVLRRLGVTLGQGYLLGRPALASDLVAVATGVTQKARL